MLRIGEFAALAGVSQRMLRHYDAIGLLQPDSVDPRSGYRIYSAAQLLTLNRIVALKALGFALDEIARLLEAQVSVDQMRDMLERRRVELRHRLRDDERRLTQIANRLSAIERDETHPMGDVVVRAVPAALMATLRARVPSLGKPVEHLFDETELHVARHSARLASTPLMLFHTQRRRNGYDIEVAVPILRVIPGTERVRVREVEGADRMLCVAYTGGYHQTDHAVRALRTWARAIGWKPAGQVREVYLRFGAAEHVGAQLPQRFLTNAESEYVTEVQMPVDAPPSRDP